MDELKQNIFDIFAHIPCFGQRCCVGDREGHVQHASKGLGHHRFAAASWPDQHDVGFRDFHVRFEALAELDSFVVVVYGYGQDFFGAFLSDYVFVEKGENL